VSFDLAADQIKLWREDPVRFVREVFHVEPDEWQKDALMSFAKNRRIAMLASKGVGKTTLLSWCCWNFLVTRPFPKIAATSISWDNLSDGLWTEMSKWQVKSPMLKQMFVWTKTRIFARDYPENWWMSARSWAKGADSSQQADSLAGLHADYMLFVLDEVGGTPDAVMAAAEAALSSGIECKLLIAGNPTHTEGPLYRAATNERHLWDVIEINSDPDNPKRSPRVSIEWAKEQIAKYSKDNPWVLVNVFGRFPPGSLNTLLSVDEVRDSMKRGLREQDYMYAQKRLGVDCARFGDDRTVLFPRQGLRAFKPVELRNARTNEIAARVMLAKSKWGSELEFIDDTGGFGAGVIDSLMQNGIAANGVHFSGKAIDQRYLNKRAEIWFNMAEWIKRGGCLPDLPELVGELTTPTYYFQNGKFQIEPKDHIKERLGASPDLADALALTFSLPDMPSSTAPLVVGLSEKRFKFEYDPFGSKD
jgi:phage terminase large subunit